MKKIFTFLFLVAGFVTTTNAQITATAAGGDWNTAATWVGGSIPIATDNVVIPSGSAVTIASATGVTNSCTNLTIDVGGNLRYIPYYT